MIALLMCFIPLNYGCYSKENKLNSKKADNLPSAPPQGKVKNEPNYCLGCGQSNDKTNQFIPVVLGDVIDLVCGKEFVILPDFETISIVKTKLLNLTIQNETNKKKICC